LWEFQTNDKLEVNGSELEHIKSYQPPFDFLLDEPKPFFWR